GAVSLLLAPLSNAWSRRNERRADHFALTLTGRPAAFVSAMRRLGAQNLAEERPSRLSLWFFHTHPTIDDRIASAREVRPAWRMVFPRSTFLFLFLPLALAAFWIVPRRLRTAMLVAVSWVFYAWGEKKIVVLLALSTVFNWALALALARARAPWLRRLLLTVGIVVNIGALVYFKYT